MTAINHTHRPQDASSLPVPIRTPRGFLLLLFCWFAGQALLRALISPTANLDEAEQLMLTQDWAWGYGPQPPLYTWLQAAFFTVGGVSITSLALLKNALLFGTYSLAYLNARLITGRHEAGVVAALSLFFIPQIAWESQRDLTHSVLAALLSLATLYAFLKASSGGWRNYLLLGCVLGLGTISKYNYAIWAAGILMAAVSIERFRKTVFNRGMLLALTLASVLVAPHGLWAFRNPDKITATSSKFVISSDEPGDSHPPPIATFAARRLKGIEEAAWAVARFAAPLVAVHALVLLVPWRRRSAPEAAPTPRPIEGVLIGRALLAIALLVLAGILILGPTNFKDRWFQPILVCAPVLLAVWPLKAWDAASLRWLRRLTVLVMAAIALVIPGRVLLAGKLGKIERLNFPLPELGRTLNTRIPPGVVILADTSFLAGNMRLAMPDRRVISRAWGDPDGQPCCIVWAARKSPNPPPALEKAANDLLQSGQTVLLKGSVRNHPPLHYALGAAW